MNKIKSNIVTGKIWHARMAPVKHTFEYPVYFFKLDVDELASLSKDNFLFSLNRWNIFSLFEKNYLQPGEASLRSKVERLLYEQGVESRPETIELVSQLRYLGWVFNPVSFFFCRDHEQKLIAVIADVNNTFGEGHAYVLKDFQVLDEGRMEVRIPKVFHVSPFFERKGEYRFEFMFQPGQENIVLDYEENGVLKLASSWKGTLRPFQAKETCALLWHYPLGGWLTVIRIHFQAFILHCVKKLPIFQKPEPISAMTLRQKIKN